MPNSPVKPKQINQICSKHAESINLGVLPSRNYQHIISASSSVPILKPMQQTHMIHFE